MKILIMIMMALSTMMISLKHPLSMGFNLILMTLTASMIMTIMMKYSWYSYVLVLVMLGGMLVLFMYMASIASNEIMKFSLKLTMTVMISCIISMMIMKNEMMMNNFSIIENIENQQNMSMMKLFNGKMSIVTIMMALYLLITMIYVIFITNTFEGPMRKKN
uniref:NADH-ubiquinone oxidoreductase chain 6 n=1 Tax=Esakia hungerfordi TaxID=3095925 RepID=A0AB38Z662_9HEMI|nr:NADH dehydrogenase subunit 6 [Esakia hungerfordi]WPW46863.1 NADH dehydrogenase subunit 6 [Esakia hungerfordi]